ncbi:MAG: hypothetical protein Kow00127_17970 [Bacteroidales bacterium]
MINDPLLLIVAGTGRNAGKTTIACSLIRRFAHETGIIALKISPHHHQSVESADPVKKGNHWRLFREADASAGKDSSRFLQAGAMESYYLEATDDGLAEAYPIFRSLAGSNPVICESPALRYFVTPGLMILADRPEVLKRKENAGKLTEWADFVWNINKLNPNQPLQQFPVSLAGNRWLFDLVK